MQESVLAAIHALLNRGDLARTWQRRAIKSQGRLVESVRRPRTSVGGRAARSGTSAATFGLTQTLWIILGHRCCTQRADAYRRRGVCRTGELRIGGALRGSCGSLRRLGGRGGVVVVPMLPTEAGHPAATYSFRRRYMG